MLFYYDFILVLVPNNKQQHYVPRCYLKPFTHNGEGNAICLYSISNAKFIRFAPVKGQCAKSYFYGKDLKIEKALQIIEGDYARVIKLVQNNSALSAAELQTLREFAYLQFRRTDMALQRQKMLKEDLYDTQYSGMELSYTPKLNVSHKQMLLECIKLWIDTREIISDLEVVIVKNNSSLEFVTSDDPSICTNRLLFQRLQENTSGIGSAGTLFFMPLTPKFLLVCYDRDVYTIKGKVGHYISISKRKDINALNELQYLKAQNNIYLTDSEDNQIVEKEFNLVKPRRLMSWHKITVYVPTNDNPGKGKRHLINKSENKRYRIATENEKNNSLERLITMSHIFPNPLNWFSPLKYSLRPKFYYDGSVTGPLRLKAIRYIRKNR